MPRTPLTRKEVSHVNWIAIIVQFRLLRLVPVKVFGISTTPQILLVFTGDHQVLARTSTGNEAVAIVIAPVVMGTRKK